MAFSVCKYHPDPFQEADSGGGLPLLRKAPAAY